MCEGTKRLRLTYRSLSICSFTVASKRSRSAVVYLPWWVVRTPVASEEQTRIGCPFFLGAGYLFQGLLGLNAYAHVVADDQYLSVSAGGVQGAVPHSGKLHHH